VKRMGAPPPSLLRREESSDERLILSGHRLRLVLQCRDPYEMRLCENLTFAFAREAGLRGADVWYAAACAMALSSHAVDRGGGQLELRVVDEPRAALELELRHGGAIQTELSPRLQRARHYVSELNVAWHAGSGAVVTARKWLAAE
jgi:hypothetical protein